MKRHVEQFRKDLLELADYAGSTVNTYCATVLAFDAYARESLAIEPLACRPRHLQDWLKTISPTISRSRLRQHWFALKCFFLFLVKRGVIAKNPAEPLPEPRKHQSEKNQPVAAETVFKLLAAVNRDTWLGRRNHLIIVMLWCLGLRISELTRLVVGSFEPEHDPEKRIGLLRIKGKNKKERAMFVVGRLYDELGDYLKEPQSPREKNSPLFPVKPGKAISDDRIQTIIKEHARAVGITAHVTPHVLRHSFATEMYCAGAPCSAIQSMLGHASKAETAIYIHVPARFKAQALTKLSIFEGAAPCP